MKKAFIISACAIVGSFYLSVPAEASFLEVMDEVLVATPEFLHLNAFMYEPLIDIHPDKLIRIYNKLKDFENISIWK